MSLVFPPALQAGQRVAIVSTARKITAAELAPALEILAGWGLEVVLGDSISTEHHQFAGSDELRRRDFQHQLDDSSIRAILCARGGYGTARIIDGLDFSTFVHTPKWIAGFSDITVLNCHLLQLGCASIHGVMPVLFGQEGGGMAVETLRRALFGEALALDAPANPLNRPARPPASWWAAT
jgi:muramoyltetrapeptide carboxypeptidase